MAGAPPPKASDDLHTKLMSCDAFRAGMSTILCQGCSRLLVFPAAAKKVKCAACDVVASGINTVCPVPSCKTPQRVALDKASGVHCKSCKYAFNPLTVFHINLDKVTVAAETPVKVRVDCTHESMADRLSLYTIDAEVLPSATLGSYRDIWETQMGGSLSRTTFFRDGVKLDHTQTVASLAIKDDATLQLRILDSDSATGHHFAAHQFSGPTNCSVCKSFIWGLINQGKRCSKCKLPVHHRCAQLATGLCESHLRNVFGIVNFNDREDEGGSVEAVIGIPFNGADQAILQSLLSEVDLTKGKTEFDDNFMAQLGTITHFTDEEIQALWANYDKDESGALDRAELKLFLKDSVVAAGGTWDDGAEADAAVERFISQMDADGDGTISWEEFWNFHKSQQDNTFLASFSGMDLTQDGAQEQLYALWYHYDASGTGDLDALEVMQLLGDIEAQFSRTADGAARDRLSETDKARYRGQLDSFLGPGKRVSWDEFVQTFLPIIQATL